MKQITATIIKCAYCKGKGIDPFDLLSKESVCQVCGGKGEVEIEEPVKTCVFCSGTGENPLGARVPCIVCHGKGSVTIKKDAAICPECDGTGKAHDGLPCLNCGGKGYC